MKVLFIGGSGLISTAVTHQAIKRNIDLYVMNRGQKNDKLPPEVNIIKCDITDEKAVKKAIKKHEFDVVVNWIAYEEVDVKRDYRLFKNKTKQYVFISTASAYQKPLPELPVTEETPLDNKYWVYSQQKTMCENYLFSINNPKFNVTVIRPSHTYGDHSLVFQLKSGKYPFTLLKRMIEQKPIVLPDDGKSLWTLTYNYDFAEAFLDVLGNEKTYQNYYHITSDKVYSWNEITQSIYQALDVKPNIIYIPTDFILIYFPEFKGELYGDKKGDAIFDNSKIKSVAPHYISKTEYPDIGKRAVTYYLNTPQDQEVDLKFLKRYDFLIESYQATLYNKK